MNKPNRSWLYISCTVIAVHSLIIGWAIYFSTTPSTPLPKISKGLLVQTIAFESNPIPSNPIPSNRMTPTPIPPTRIEPTPLERKTMWPPEPVQHPQPIQHPATTQETPQPSLPPLRPEKAPPTPVQKPALKEKPVPPKPVDRKENVKKALDKANEDFKAKQQEIIIKKKQEVEALKTHQEESVLKKKQQQEAQKKQEQEAEKKKQLNN